MDRFVQVQIQFFLIAQAFQSQVQVLKLPLGLIVVKTVNKEKKSLKMPLNLITIVVVAHWCTEKKQDDITVSHLHSRNTTHLKISPKKLTLS